MPDVQTETRAVLITGAGGALGRGVVRTMLQAGHAVLAVDRVAMEPEMFLGESVGARMRLESFVGDALSPEVMERAAAAAVSAFGRLDAMFHLAGTYAYAPLADTDLDLWNGLVSTNLTSAYVGARAVLSALRASHGLMVFVGARAAISTPPNQVAYNASKAGLLALVRTLAGELRADGIRVNAVVPDIIDTPANRRSMPNSDRSRWLTVDQIAGVLLFLLSDAASGVTGAAINLQRT